MLNQAGVKTVGDLQDYRGDLRALVGSFGPKLRQFAIGEDDRPFELGEPYCWNLRDNNCPCYNKARNAVPREVTLASMMLAGKRASWLMPGLDL